MKGLITLAVLAGLFVTGAYWFIGKYVTSDTGEMIAFACGNPNGEQQEIQIAIPIAFPRREPPRTNPENGYVFWDEWILEHYAVIASTGERVTLVRQHNANLLPDAKVGTPDSYLVGNVKTGVEYRFDFMPSLAEGKCYRRVFTVGADGVPFRRENFELVKGG